MIILQRGDQFQDYNVHEVHRVGGLTAAYRVQTSDESRMLTLWTLDLSGVSEEDTLPRRLFERFAALKLLDHPNLLPVVDFGQTGDVFYWLTPFVRGKLLTAWIEEAFPGASTTPASKTIAGPKEKETAGILTKVAGALAVLWGANLIHGSLSPDTVIITEDGQPLVFQYGLNDLFLAAQAGRVPTGEWSLGLAHPAFSAPEQVLNRAVDWRTDQFALGALAAALRLGRSPFAGEGPVEAALRATSPLQWPHQPRLVSRMSTTYRRWVARSCACRPVDRFSDPVKMLRPLERLENGKGSRIPLRRGLLPSMPLSPFARVMQKLWLMLAMIVLGLGVWAGVSGAIILFDPYGPKPQMVFQVSMVGPLAPLATPNPTIVAARRASPTPTATNTLPPTPTATSSSTPLPPTATATARATQRPTQIPPTATPTSFLPSPIEGQVRLWDDPIEAGPAIAVDTAAQLVETRRLGLGRLNQAAVTSNGRVQAVASTAGVWLQEYGKSTFLDVGDEASAVVFSPEDSLLLVGLRGGDIQAWRWQGGFELAATLQGHTGRVQEMAFTPDAQRIVSVSDDGTARVWLLSEGREEHLIAASLKPLESLAVSVKGNWLATGGRDGVIRVWDVATGERLMEFSFSEPVTALKFTDGERPMIIIGGEKGRLVYWSTYTRQPASQFVTLRNTVTAIDIGPTLFTESSVRIATADPDIWIYYADIVPDGQGGIRLQQIEPATKQNPDPWLADREVLPSGFIFRCDTVFEREGTGFFSIRWDGYTAQNSLSWKKITPMRYQPITRLAVSENGKWLAASGTGEVYVFSADTGNLARTLGGSLPPGTPFDPESQSLLVVDDQSETSNLQVLWNKPVDIAKGSGTNLGAYKSGALVGFLKNEQLVVQSNGVQAAFTDLANGLPAFVRVSGQDGCQVLGSTGEERPLLFYTGWGLMTVNDEKTRGVCKLAEGWGRFVGAFSADQSRIALTQPDGTIQMIDNADGKVLWQTTEALRPAWLLFVPAGDVLIAGMPTGPGAPGGVRLLDAASGSQLAELNSPTWGKVVAGAVTPDGKRMYLATQDGMIHQYEVRP